MILLKHAELWRFIFFQEIFQKNSNLCFNCANYLGYSMDLSIIKHLLIIIILIILCLCTMPLNSNIDVCVKSNITFQHVCFVHEFQTVLRCNSLLKLLNC